MNTFTVPLIGMLGFFYLIFYKLNFAWIFDKIYCFMRAKKLAVNENLESELIKVNLLRIATGLILCHRTFYTIFYQFYIDAFSLQFFIGIIVLLCSLLIIIGFLVPIAIWILILFNMQFDSILFTSTLGTDVLQIILMILGCLPAGDRLSIDATLIKKSWLNQIIRPIYWFFGKPTLEKFSILKLLAIITYGMVCLYSVTVHFNDVAWMSGDANILILTNSYLSKYYEFFRSFSENYSYTAILLSTFTIYGMIIWELFFIPTIFLNHLTQSFTIYWGFLFFLVSTFLLQLGWLPYYEYVLWGLLFWQSWKINPLSTNELIILYDDKCNLCDKSIYWISKLDLFKIVKFEALSQSSKFLEAHNISKEEAYRYLYGIDNHNQFYKGYNLYLVLTKKILLLLPLWPLFYLGSLLKIGPIIYNYIAKHRIEWFGVCTIPTVNSTIHQKNFKYSKGNDNQNFLKAFFGTFLICWIAYTIRMPILNSKLSSKINAFTYPIVKDAMRDFGMDALDVFNFADLHMGNNFYTLSRNTKNDEWILLPLTGMNGQRLKWHESDRLYFGNSLGWRRSNVNAQHACELNSIDKLYLADLIKFDNNNNKINNAIYKIDYFYQDLPFISKMPYLFKLHKINHICSIVFDKKINFIRRYS